MLKNRKPSRSLTRIPLFTAIGVLALITAAAAAAATGSASQFAFIDSVQEFFGMASVTTPTRTAAPIGKLRETANLLSPEPRRMFVTIYNWNNGAGGSWATATNWTPTRTTPATDDIMQFSAGGSFTVTGVPTETIGQLNITNNMTVNLQPAAAANILTISGGGVFDEFQLSPGCTLNLNSANALTIAVASGSNANINGSIAFTNAAHRLTGVDASGVVFKSGSSFTAGTSFSGNPFGTTNLNSVAFNSGSTYVLIAGSNPFGAGSPNSVVVFQPGSLFSVQANTTPSFSGRTYANVEVNSAAANLTVTGGSAVTMDNLTVTLGTLNFNMTGVTGHAIKGNISVASGATLNFAPASAGTVNLNGTALQTISGTGTLSFSAFSTIVASNAVGVTLQRSFPTSGALTVSGIFNTGTNVISGSGSFTLTSGTATMGGANSYTGPTTISGGILSASIIGIGGGNSGIGASSSAAANLVFDGGTLSVPNGTTDRSFTINAGKTATIATTGGSLTISGGSPVSTGGLSVTGGSVQLTGTHLYTGTTTIAGGTLQLSGSGSIASSAIIDIQGGAFFDPGALTTPLVFSSGQTLKGSGTTTTGSLGTSPSGVTLAANSPLVFPAFNGATPPITTSGGGTFTVASTNLVTVSTTTQLAAGDYVLVARCAFCSITGTAPTLSGAVGGSGIAAGTTASIAFDVFSQIVLRVTAVPTPTVNLSVNTNTGSEAAATVVTVTATASSPVTGAQTVNLAVTGTNITAGDYTLVPTTITIPNGGTTGTATFTVVDDPLYEGPETATITESSPSSGITLGATTFQNVAITDNEAIPATLVVNSNADTTDGFCTSNTGGCTLREAMNAANSNPDTTTINFAIPSGPVPPPESDTNAPQTGCTVSTITPATPLPAITAPVIMDGYTQPGSSVNTAAFGLPVNAVLCVEISGANLSTQTVGIPTKYGIAFKTGSSGSSVRGMVVNRFGDGGIIVNLEAINLPLDIAGNITIAGNFIGLNPDGTDTDVGNTQGGIIIFHSIGDTIGGVNPADRNVISAVKPGNGSFATYGCNIDLENLGGLAAGILDGQHIVRGNYIGTDATGTVATGNLDTSGICTTTAIGENVIGGTATGAGNLISGNNGGLFGAIFNAGIDMRDLNNTVQGNRIGTTADGVGALGNGLGIFANSPGQIIGGVAVGAGNLIANSNRYAINSAAGTNTISGNTFTNNGTVTPLPTINVGLNGNMVTGNTITNNNGPGISISFGTGNTFSNNTITGAISTVSGQGIRVLGASTQVSITGNSIYNNGNLGIDLGTVDVTPNDPGDGDTGPNGLQNFPTVTAAVAGTTTVSGTLNSTPAQTFTIEAFSNDACDGSGNGEGKVFLGSVVTGATNGSGDVTFAVPVSPGLVFGKVITTTARDASGNTSEFSPCFTVGAPPPLAVSSTNPADAAPGVATSSTVAVTFDQAANPATITTQASAGACSGNLQVSSNNFSSCIGLGTPVSSGGNTIFTSTPSPALANVTTYKIRVTTGATSALGAALASQFTQATGFTTVTLPPTVTTNAASSVAVTTATLNGSANPNGNAATGYFRYATTSPGTCNDTFGTRAPATGGTALGSGTSAVAYTEAITGLSPLTTYHYCAIASNGGGTAFGSVLTFTTGAETGVTLTSGALVISDDNGGSSADVITLSCNSSNLRINDPGRSIAAGPGTTQVDPNTVEVPFASLMSVTVNLLGGNDSLTVDLSGGNPIPVGGINYNGGVQTGTPGDILNIIGGSATTQTFNFTNENDGNVVLAGSTAGTISYTGLEPVSSSVNAANVVLNYSAVTETIAVTDAGGGQTAVDSNVGGESVTFNNPTASLQINGGDTGDDTINVNGFGSGFGANLTINGGTGNDVVNLNTNITFASGNSLDVDLVNDNASPGVDTINVGTSASLQLSGAGTATLNASRNVTTGSSSSVTTANGNVTITANPAGTTTGAFTGVNIAGTVEATGTGKVTVAGKGGNSGASQYGVVVNGGIIRGGSGSGVKTEVTGTGASNNTTSAHGVSVNDFSTITSNGGDVLVTGTGGAGSAAVDQSNYGVIVFGTNGSITSGGTGAVTVNGFGGTADNNNVGVIPSTGGTITSGGSGAVVVSGTGGPGVFGLGVEVFGNGKITSGGGTVNVTGTSASSDGVLLTTGVADALITSGGGAVTVTGVSNPGAFGILLNQGGGGQSKISSGSNANITLIADKMLLDNGNTAVDAGLGAVTIRQFTNNIAVDLGGADSPTSLGLTDAELDKVTAATINIGDTNTGPIEFTADPSVTRGAPTNLVFTNGGTSNILLSAGQISSAGGNITFNPGSGGFTPRSNFNFESFSGAGTTKVSSGRTLALRINNTTANGGYDQHGVAGLVDIDQAVLSFSGSYVPTGGETFVIILNDGNDAITGTFAGLPDEAILPNFRGSTLNARIDYQGGDGNDCVITMLAPLPEIQFSAPQFYEDESQTATITITRAGDLTNPSSVSFNTAPGGNATGGATCTGTVDYVVPGSPLPRTINFGSMVATQTVLIDICGETTPETLETLNLALSGATNANLGTQTTAVLNINDTASQFLSVIPHQPIDMTLGSAANPYPSQIVVAGAPNIVGGMRVTLYDIWHDNPDNIDVLLVGPQGQKYVLMADVGGPFSIGLGAPVTLTFSDIAPAALDDSATLATGHFRPTSCETPVLNFFGPAPVGPYVEPGCAFVRPPSKTLFGTPPTGFGMTNPNGTWKLFVRDDNGSLRPVEAAQTVVGSISGGWGLEFLAPTAADVSIGGRVLTAGGRGIRGAFVTVTGNSLVSPINVTTGVNGRYTVPGLTAGETYVVTVRSRRFFFDQPSRVITLNDNVADADFIGSTGTNREQ